MPKPTVKQIRKDLKLTQKKFMALCGIDDITTVYFSILERGKGSMSMTHRAKIAIATGYEIFEIDWIRFNVTEVQHLKKRKSNNFWTIEKAYEEIEKFLNLSVEKQSHLLYSCQIKKY